MPRPGHDPDGHEITEGFIQDFNKNMVIELKKQSLIAMGLSEAMPTIEYTRLAYGKVNSFAGSLTHQNIKSNKEFLDEKRLVLKEIGFILNGHSNGAYLMKLRQRYHVQAVQVRTGSRSMHYTELKNLPVLVSRLREILTELVEYSQMTGFGSAKAANRRYGNDNLMEECGLEPSDIGAE